MIDKQKLQQEVDKHKFNFGRIFQCKLILALLYDKAFFLQIKDTISPSYFEDEGLSWLVRNILNYYDQYKQIPTFDTINILISGIEDKTLTVLVNRTINEINTYNDNLYQDAQFIKQHSLDFCIRRDVSKQLIELDELIYNSDSLDNIASKVNTIKRTVTIDNNTEHSSNYKQSVNERYKEGAKFREVIPTGWDVIDKIMKGGLGKGELGIIVAPTGVGKSWGLINMAVNAAKLGFNVVYVSLELYTNVINHRFDSVLTGLAIDDLRANKDFVQDKLSQMSGNIFVEYAPTKSLTIDGLKARLEKYISSDIEIDELYIDYGDILKVTGGYKEKRLNLEELFEEMRGLAGELTIPVWTASQSNREGSQHEVVEGYHLAESFAKLNPADFCMSFQRLGKNKKLGVGNCNIIKNRFGDEGDVFLMKTDLSRGYVDLFEESSEQGMEVKFQINEVNEITSKEQNERIQSIINKIRKP